MHKLQLSISRGFYKLPISSRQIEDYCIRAGFKAHIRFRIQVVVAEAINNIIAYATPDTPILLSCLYEEDPDELMIEIIDNGKPLNNIPDYEFPECEVESGRGWPTTFNWMDSVSHVRQGEQNHLTMKISRTNNSTLPLLS